MNSLELSSTRDKTENNHTINHRFTKEMQLPGYISLSNITLYHNWRNVTAKRGNNWFFVSAARRDKIGRFSSGSGLVVAPDLNEVERAVVNSDYNYFETNANTIPDGSYSVEDLNNFIHLIMNEKESETDLERDFGINLYPNPTYNRVSVSVSENYILVLSEELADMLGTKERIFSNLEKNLELTPKIDRITKILVHCDLVQNEFQQFTNLLFTFKPDKGIGRLLSPKIYYPIWKNTRKANVRGVKVWLTDQDGNLLEFEDDWSVTLLLKNNA